MLCPACGAENHGDRLFCRECGLSLASTCPSCGAANEPGDKFCGRCGQVQAEATTPAEKAAPAQPGERRFVTALFADLVGFTPFSEAHDAEEVRALLTTYFDRSREIVERFGGVVDKFIGDAVTAFWGATVAHEDDPERAVRAALELVDMVSRLGKEIDVPELAVRAGVLSGETSVGPGGNQKGLVVGDVVNTASRLQSAAEPGAVLVGESTYRLVREAIDFEAVGEQSLRGKSLPVPAWRARRVLAERGGAGRTEALEPPFVAREEELRLIKDLFHAAGRDSRARLVSVVGEVGIGKSRLMWELQKYLDGLVEDVYWHEGRSPAYGEGLTFWALGEMVRRRAGIAETEDDHRTRTKLRTAVAEYIPDPDEQRWVEPRLVALLGLEAAPVEDRAELYAAWRTFFERVSERGTTVLVFEDLHWADAGVLDFMEELVEFSRQRPILVITLARPELVDRRPGWGTGRTNLLSLHLAPLPDLAIKELVEGMVPGIPRHTVELIVARAAGVPLYAVELVRILVTEGDLVSEDGLYRLVGKVDELAVPESLHAVIGARLDRLQPDERTLLQDAAVLGQAFTIEALVALGGRTAVHLEEGLGVLVRKELLVLDRDPRSPERGQYRFVQGLVREVAYGRLSREERRARHLAVARYFEAKEDLELAAVVATHYQEAHRESPPGPEAEELAGKARDALRGAAQRAAALHSHQQALALCEQALEITEDPQEQARLRELAAASSHAVLEVDRAVELANQALADYRRAEDDSGAVRAGRLLARILTDTRRSDEAVQVIAPLIERRDPAADVEVAGAAAELTRSYMVAGDQQRAVEVASEAIVAAEQLDLVAVAAEAMITKGTALATLGRAWEGIALLKGALELVEDHDLPDSEPRTLNNLGYVLQADDLKEMAEYNRRKLERARRIGEPRLMVTAIWDVAENQHDFGQYAEARALLDEIDTTELPTVPRVYMIELLKARIQALCGEPEEAERRSYELFEEIADVTDVQIQQSLELQRSWLAILNGRVEEAFQRAMAVDDTRPYPRDLRGAGVAACLLADRAKVSQVLTNLEERNRRGRRVEALTLALTAALEALDGRMEPAIAEFEKAIRLMEEVDSPIEACIWRACFARLMGVDDPEAAEAAAQARQTLIETGSTTYLRIFFDDLPAEKSAAPTRAG